MTVDKKALFDIHTAALTLSQSLLKMFPRIEGELLIDQCGELEERIGYFLATVIRVGHDHKLSEEGIQQTVKAILNAQTRESGNVDFQRYSDTVTKSQREALAHFFKRLVEMGVDLPDFVNYTPGFSQSLSLLWQGTGQPGRRQDSVEIILANDKVFYITVWESARPFSKVTTSDQAASLLEDREYFVKRGLCPEASIVDKFNPLRIFGK